MRFSNAFSKATSNTLLDEFQMIEKILVLLRILLLLLQLLIVSTTTSSSTISSKCSVTNIVRVHSNITQYKGMWVPILQSIALYHGDRPMKKKEKSHDI